jgi:hypothetical protein
MMDKRFPSFPRRREPVRPTGRLISAVEVRAEVSHSLEVEGNCVAARRGGEQPETNWRSVGDEPDSAECCDEPAGLRRSLEHTARAVMAEKATCGRHHVFEDGTLGRWVVWSGEIHALCEGAWKSEPA